MPIEELIEKSFNDLIKAITTDGTSSQLIFPCYRDGNERRSEQELRQIFLRNVEEDKTYFYSVETPTKLVYCISNSEQPIGKENHETGDHHRSGNYDVTLYNENKIESLVTCIEFKHRNSKSICKDLLKLAKEVKLTKEKKNFFVHYYYVEENNWKSETFSNLFEKYRESVDEIENKIEDKNDLSKVIVYLVCIHGKGKTASTYHFSLADLKKNYTVGTNYNDIKDKSWLNEKIFNTEE